MTQIKDEMEFEKVFGSLDLETVKEEMLAAARERLAAKKAALTPEELAGLTPEQLRERYELTESKAKNLLRQKLVVHGVATGQPISVEEAIALHTPLWTIIFGSKEEMLEARALFGDARDAGGKPLFRAVDDLERIMPAPQALAEKLEEQLAEPEVRQLIESSNQSQFPEEMLGMIFTPEHFTPDAGEVDQAWLSKWAERYPLFRRCGARFGELRQEIEDSLGRQAWIDRRLLTSEEKSALEAHEPWVQAATELWTACGLKQAEIQKRLAEIWWPERPSCPLYVVKVWVEERKAWGFFVLSRPYAKAMTRILYVENYLPYMKRDKPRDTPPSLGRYVRWNYHRLDTHLEYLEREQDSELEQSRRRDELCRDMKVSIGDTFRDKLLAYGAVNVPGFKPSGGKRSGGEEREGKRGRGAKAGRKAGKKGRVHDEEDEERENSRR